MVKKIGACSNNIEHGQNIFELADGIGSSKGQIISKGLFGTLEFFQKMNVEAILCTENCPNVRFLEESRRPKVLSKLTDL